MKKTLLIALISGTIFSMNGATNTIIQNNTNNIIETTLENTVTKKQLTFSIKPGEKTGILRSNDDSTVTLKSSSINTILKNPEVELIQIMPEGVIKYKN